MVLNRSRKHRLFLAVIVVVSLSAALVNVQSTQAGPYAPNFQQARWIWFGNIPLSSSDAAQRYAVGDFNGDHKSDLLFKANNSHLWVALSNGYLFAQSEWTYGWNFGNASTGADAASRYAVADFTGDGKSDVLFKNSNGTMWVATSNGGTFSQANWTNGWWFGNNPLSSSDAAQRYAVGDFNGDGRSDVLWKGNNSHMWVALSNGSSFAQSEWTYGWNFGNASTGADAASRYAVADFTGDGKSDVLFKNSNGHMWVATSNGGTFSQSEWTYGWFFGQDSLGTADAAQRYMTGDFNGDGKSDLLYKAYNNEMWVALSIGSSFVQSRWAAAFGSSANGADAAGRYETGDFNGDGKTDLLYKDSGAKLWVAYSTGSTFETAVDGMPGGFFGLNPLDSTEAANRYDHGDFNNDGKTDLLFKHTDGGMWVALASLRPYKGVGMTNSPCEDLTSVNAAWEYNWSPETMSCPGVENVPMVHGSAELNALLNGTRTLGGNSAYILGFNEPDSTLSPTDVVPLWHQLETWANVNYPGKKLVSPAIMHTDVRTWLPQFREAYRTQYGVYPRFDVLAAHCYDTVNNCKDLIQWYESKVSAWSIPDGIWLTEYGFSAIGPCIGSSSCNWSVGVDAMNSFTTWLKSRSQVRRFAWFANRYVSGVWFWPDPNTTTRLFCLAGGTACSSNDLTPLGTAYKAQ